MTRSREGGPRRPVRLLRDAVHSRSGRAVAVVGLASRAIVYGSLAALVFGLAAGTRHSDTDQGSALARLGDLPAGPLLLVALVAGVACYTLWRWSTAFSGRAESRWDRVRALVEGAAYLPFGYLAIAVLVGDPGRARQGREYRVLSARVLADTLGRVVVSVVGVVVVVVGAVFVYQGVRRTFAGHFDFPRHRPWVRPTVLALGAVGSVSRGLVFALAGVLVIYAAITVTPSAAGGLDSALDTLAHQHLGTLLLLASACGFAAFAVFAVAEAVWRDPTKA